MRKKYWILIGVFVFVAVSFGLLWQFAGVREQIGFKEIFWKMTDAEEEAELRKLFYTGKDNRFYGGVLAYVGKNGVLVWGNIFPKYFAYGSETILGRFVNCSFEKYAEAKRGDPDARVDFKASSNADEWRKLVKPGMHVFVEPEDGKIRSIIANLDVELHGYTPLFCTISKTVPQQ